VSSKPGAGQKADIPEADADVFQLRLHAVRVVQPEAFPSTAQDAGENLYGNFH
jgi:hypothetical protein